MKHSHVVRAAGALLLLLLLAAFQAAASGPLAALPTGLRALVDLDLAPTEVVRAVAMTGRVPTAEDVAALRALGLVVQPLEHLPMALTKGTVPQLVQAFARGIARDLYIDQPLKWHSAESTAAMAADVTRALGYTGAGVGIAIVDSGIDASHPILADHVVRNVRVYSPEYLEISGIQQPTGIEFPHSPALVIPFDALPYNNTDTIGHGTHVAGIAAGDGTDNDELIGVAPDAQIVGYSTGEVLFIFTALASFDDIMATREQYNIRVINNSWGSNFQLFDPQSPINVATRALYDAGIVVVFSAGNDGVEMTTNVNSMAPWVINSGSGTVSQQKSDFSSSGLMFDNSEVVEVVDNHVRIEGDGLGLSHPDVSAPGSSIVSSGTPTGVTTTPGTPPGGSATASGTSMSAPHVSGLAAVLLQANPNLTPDQVRQVMQVTATPMRDDAALWQSGYGFAHAADAVALVLRSDFSQALLDELQAPRDAAALARREYKVVASDRWMFVERGATVAGLETYAFSFEVGADTEAIRASVAFPADLGVVGLNVLFEWALSLIDPDGNVVAASELLPNVGVGLLHLDFAQAGIGSKPGTWTIEASGEAHLAQPALLWGHLVTVAVTQLQRQAATGGPTGPVFTPSGALLFSFAGGDGPLTSPESCSYNPAGASGTLSLAGPDADCHAGQVGYAVNYQAETPASFVSEPLAEATTLGGAALLRLHLVNEILPIYNAAGLIGTLTYAIDAVDDAGTVVAAVAGGEFPVIAGGTPVLGEYPFEVPPAQVPAGARLRLQMQISGFYTSTMRLLWGGEFGDSGLLVTTGTLSGAPAAEQKPGQAAFGGGGASAWYSLLLLGAGVIPRARRRARATGGS